LIKNNKSDLYFIEVSETWTQTSRNAKQGSPVEDPPQSVGSGARHFLLLVALEVDTIPLACSNVTSALLGAE